MASVQRLKKLRQQQADAKADLKVQEKRKKAILLELKELGVKKSKDIPTEIEKCKKRKNRLKNKLDECLTELENEFSDLDT